MYKIWNDTDDISASMETFATKELANAEIVKLRDRYRKQGYYRDNGWNKIDPDDIQYRVTTQARGAAIRQRNPDTELV